MDAGAKGRRLLQRREYKAKVSEFVPKELEDQFSHDKNGELVFELDLKKIGGKLKSGLKKIFTGPVMKPNITKDQHLQKIRNQGGDPSHWANSFEPEGEMIEANSAQMKAMQDAKVKKMEDDKVAKKTKKEEVQVEAKKSCGEGEYYCNDSEKCKPIPEGMKVGKDGMLVSEDMKGMSQKSGDKRSTESGAGMTAKGVAKYNRRTGGKLKTAVTTPPSKLKAGSKAANRRKSFCARSKSWNGPRGKAARRRWNCSYEPELPMIIDEKKKLFNAAPLSDRVAAWSKKITEGDSYVKSDRNKFGLPKDLKSVEKKVDKKVTGVNYGAMAQSYVPQGEVIAENPLAIAAGIGIGAGGLYLANKLRRDAKTKKDGTLGGQIQSRTDTLNKLMQQNSFKPEGEVIDEVRMNQGMGDLAKKMNLDPNKPGDYMKLKRLLRNQGKDKAMLSMGEAKYEKGASDYGKTSIRNKRAFGKGGNAAPPKERGGAKMIRLDLHKKRRFVKKNNKYGATNKPPVDGAPSDEFKKNKNVREGNLHKWFKGSKSKDGKGGWVNVVTGGTCASDKPGEGTPKCVSSSKRASMSKAERLSASRRKKKADPGQQSKSGAAKPTYVATDKKKKVDEMNQGPSTPVSMSGGKLQFNKGGAGIGKIKIKGGGALQGMPIPKV